MLTIQHLYKSYGHFQAVNDLNLHIKKGCSFGFVGPNGAGKTTTMKIVSGLLMPDSGKVLVDGVDAFKNIQERKAMIGYMPDFFGVYDNLKTMEYMEFYASMYGLIGEDTKRRCRQLLELVNLTEKEEVYVDSLSRGMKQRLCLARCLVHEPKLLILDEPASGLDPRARFEMKEIIKRLVDLDKTIMISSHILPELMQMCNRIGIMEDGKLVLEGNIEEVLKKAQQTSAIHIQIVGEQENAIKILKENKHVRNISIRNEEIFVNFYGDEKQEAQLLQSLVMQQVQVNGFAKEAGNLETLFMNLTKKEKEE